MKKRFVVLCSAGLLVAGCTSDVEHPYVSRMRANCEYLMKFAITHTDTMIVYAIHPGDSRGFACVQMLHTSPVVDSLNRAAR